MSASRARISPEASERFETTTATEASRRASLVASMMDCRLLPRPEIKTAMGGRELFAFSAIFGPGIDFATNSSMPRRRRAGTAGIVHHVMFLRVLIEARRRFRMRILAYVVMPNHWHLI